MVFLLDRVASPITGVALPDLEADPAKLVLAPAGHVDAASVLVD